MRMIDNANRILVSGQQMKRLYEAQFEELCHLYQITQNETDIIVFLANNPGYDTARDIAEMRMIAKSYVSKSVENLIKKGFLLRIADREDRRIVHLKLTDKSFPIVENARLKQKLFINMLFEGMSIEEINAFESSVLKIMDNVRLANNKI